MAALYWAGSSQTWQIGDAQRKAVGLGSPERSHVRPATPTTLSATRIPDLRRS